MRVAQHHRGIVVFAAGQRMTSGELVGQGLVVDVSKLARMSDCPLIALFSATRASRHARELGFDHQELRPAEDAPAHGQAAHALHAAAHVCHGGASLVRATKIHCAKIREAMQEEPLHLDGCALQRRAIACAFLCRCHHLLRRVEQHVEVEPIEVVVRKGEAIICRAMHRNHRLFVIHITSQTFRADGLSGQVLQELLIEAQQIESRGMAKWAHCFAPAGDVGLERSQLCSAKELVHATEERADNGEFHITRSQAFAPGIGARVRLCPPLHDAVNEGLRSGIHCGVAVASCDVDRGLRHRFGGVEARVAAAVHADVRSGHCGLRGGTMCAAQLEGEPGELGHGFGRTVCGGVDHLGEQAHRGQRCGLLHGWCPRIEAFAAKGRLPAYRETELGDRLASELEDASKAIAGKERTHLEQREWRAHRGLDLSLERLVRHPIHLGEITAQVGVFGCSQGEAVREVLIFVPRAGSEQGEAATVELEGGLVRAFSRELVACSEIGICRTVAKIAIGRQGVEGAIEMMCCGDETRRSATSTYQHVGAAQMQSLLGLRGEL